MLEAIQRKATDSVRRLSSMLSPGGSMSVRTSTYSGGSGFGANQHEVQSRHLTRLLVPGFSILCGKNASTKTWLSLPI